jgi:hypothetical protein
MAAAAARLASEVGATWLSSGLTAEDGVPFLDAYSAEVASEGAVFMFPEASRLTRELWTSVTDERLKAKMPKLPWRLCPAASPEIRSGHAAEAARSWASAGLSEHVKESASRSFQVDLQRGFIDYFACMDDFASMLKPRGTP